jgi:hypothetical protein
MRKVIKQPRKRRPSIAPYRSMFEKTCARKLKGCDYEPKDACNPNIQIIFIFQSPQTPMPNARVRKKCGTKQSHAEWAEKNNFLWCTKDTIKKEWLK